MEDLINLMWNAKIALDKLADGLSKYPEKQKETRDAATMLCDWIEGVKESPGKGLTRPIWP